MIYFRGTREEVSHLGGPHCLPIHALHVITGVLSNSVNPETPHNEAYDQGLHCLP